MDRAGHPAGCLFAAVSLPCGLFRKRCLLRWVNFKTIINQEKPLNQRLCIAETETIQKTARYSRHFSIQSPGGTLHPPRGARSGPKREGWRARQQHRYQISVCERNANRSPGRAMASSPWAPSRLKLAAISASKPRHSMGSTPRLGSGRQSGCRPPARPWRAGFSGWRWRCGA